MICLKAKFIKYKDEIENVLLEKFSIMGTYTCNK